MIMNNESVETEEAVIGACLVEGTALPLVADKLRPEMFYKNSHQLLFKVMLDMYGRGDKIDILTVKEALLKEGKLEAVGGPFGIVNLSSKMGSAAHLEYHAAIVKQKYIRRMMTVGFSKLSAQAVDETMDLGDVMAAAHDLIDRMENEFGGEEHLRDMPTLMKQSISQAEDRAAKNKDGVTGITTGLTELDGLTSGLQNGELTIIAARPSVGKTAFALHLARRAAETGHAVAVYSLEMQGERLADRWLVSASDINPRNWRNGTFSDKEGQAARLSAGELSKLPIWVDDDSNMSMEHIRHSARLLKSRGACDMVVIDYLQLCDVTDRENAKRTREQEVSQASRKAKLLAKELNIPIVLLSQLNREVDNKIGGRPELSNLRESGSIEQDADTVLLLYRPALAHLTYDMETHLPTEGLGVILVAKQRNGETGRVNFHHNRSLTRIEDYPKTTI